ncbi:dicarboxylate/amino acid:cation symporter [Fluviispira vulneris]|uniref:dicarboxylate/amino acid:cation symporter n=1 Tax=Fluviispira vulneris TaxID=2763012 RepID=UPI00164872FF|nr:dicarboxylate/amino acid:cation symporter [Fluviispira vulneris]
MFGKLFKKKSDRDLIVLLLSIFFGGLCGYFVPNFIQSIEWIGKIFMNTLMMLVLPLIFLALVGAITSLSDISKLGSLGKVTILIIIINVASAALIGLLLSLFLKPGIGVNPSLMGHDLQALLTDSSKNLGFSEFILGMFPANLGEVAIRSQILPIVVFGIFFSIVALRMLNKNSVSIALKVCSGFKEILMGMISFVMKLTPIALFSLIGNSVSSSLLKGNLAEDMLGIFKFLIIFLLGCVILCVLQFIILRILSGKNANTFLTQSIGCVSTGFATASSLATLPVMLIAAETQKIDETIAKFALPLTVVFNLGSSALYVSSATLFVSQVLGIEISGLNIFLIYITTVITGLGTTGIPNAGFIATVTVLKTISVPPTTVAILFPIDAVLGRVRTSVNIWGHLVCTKLIQIWLTKQR